MLNAPHKAAAALVEKLQRSSRHGRNLNEMPRAVPHPGVRVCMRKASRCSSSHGLRGHQPHPPPLPMLVSRISSAALEVVVVVVVGNPGQTSSCSRRRAAKSSFTADSCNYLLLLTCTRLLTINCVWVCVTHTHPHTHTILWYFVCAKGRHPFAAPKNHCNLPKDEKMKQQTNKV